MNTAPHDTGGFNFGLFVHRWVNASQVTGVVKFRLVPYWTAWNRPIDTTGDR